MICCNLLSLSVQEICLSSLLPGEPVYGDGLAPSLSDSLSCSVAVSVNTGRVPADCLDCFSGFIVNSQL